MGLATRYGPNGPGMESRFSLHLQTGPGAHLASYAMGTGSLSRRVNRLGRGVDHSPHLAPRLKKELGFNSTPTLGPQGLLKDKLYASHCMTAPKTITNS